MCVCVCVCACVCVCVCDGCNCLCLGHLSVFVPVCVLMHTYGYYLEVSILEVVSTEVWPCSLGLVG